MAPYLYAMLIGLLVGAIVGVLVSTLINGVRPEPDRSRARTSRGRYQ